MSELLPCPFCGGEAHAYKNNLWHVACERAHSGCVTMSAFVTEAEAIAAWNTRANPDFGFDALPMTEENMVKYGWVRERTCKFVSSRGPDYPPVCSACGYDPGIYECAWYEDGTYGYERNYCPECGAKVVE